MKYKKKYMEQQKQIYGCGDPATIEREFHASTKLSFNGGKCSSSSLSNLKIIKGHGFLFDDPFIIPKNTQVITLFNIGYDTPMIPNLELEILQIFQQNKDGNDDSRANHHFHPYTDANAPARLHLCSENDYFDFSTNIHTDKEYQFEKMMLQKHGGIQFAIRKWIEKEQINNQTIIFENELCGIYCSNNNFTKCFPVIYGKKIFNKMSKKGFIYQNATKETIKFEHKYIKFEINNGIDIFYIMINNLDLSNEYLNFEYTKILNNEEKTKNNIINTQRLNRIKIILFYLEKNNCVFMTENIMTTKYNKKPFTFINDEIIKLERIDRYPVKIDNERVLVKEENIFVYEYEKENLSFKQIMELNLIDFINRFAVNIPINISDVDESLTIENKYNIDLDGTLNKIDENYIYVNIMKTEIKQINLQDLIILEGPGKYFLYTCRSCNAVDLPKLRDLD